MKKEPLVVCLTNTVAANFTANVLLSIGARPAMIEDPSEASELVRQADGLLVNVGTLTKDQAETMTAAITAAERGTDPIERGIERGTVPAEKGTVPWVLDPVACHCLSFRWGVVERLLRGHRPSLIRGNDEEISFIRSFCVAARGTDPIAARETDPITARGTDPITQRGIDSISLGTVPMLATGAVDRIYVGDERPIEIAGGVEMLQQVTATGCAQGAMCAACLGWGQTPVEACVSASRLMKRAGELAWKRGRTPGRFQIALLDALYELTRGENG